MVLFRVVRKTGADPALSTRAFITDVPKALTPGQLRLSWTCEAPQTDSEAGVDAAELQLCLQESPQRQRLSKILT